MALETGGQVDWVALVDKAVTVPIGMLSRYSQAGIQPYTLDFCQAMGQLFRRVLVSRLDSFEVQLNQAKAVGFSSKLLYIGTGISAIPRQLAATKGGISFSIIAFALRSCFSPEYTARVLDEIMKLAVPEDTHTPPSGQVQLLCAEVMAASKDRGFLQMLETISCMMSGMADTQDVPAADDMATSILGLFTLPEGETAVIKAKDSMIGWLVVFAHWYLGYKVSLFIDGHLLWDNESVFLTRGFDHTAAGTSEKRAVPKCEIIFKAVSMANNNGGIGGNGEEIQLFREANVNIILERRDSQEQSGWSNAIPLDEMLALILQPHINGPDSDQIRSLFIYSLADILRCKLHNDTGEAKVDLGIRISDIVSEDRLQIIIQYLFRNVGVSKGITPRENDMERLRKAYHLEEDEKSEMEWREFKEQANTKYRVIWLRVGHLLDAAMALIFLNTEDFSILTIPKSWRFVSNWINNKDIQSEWLGNGVFYYSTILQLIWNLTDLNPRSFKPDRKRRALLGVTSKGLYIFNPMLLNTDFNSPPEELVKLHIGPGAIYINGHLASEIHGSGDNHIDKGHAGYQNIYAEPDGCVLQPFVFDPQGPRASEEKSNRFSSIDTKAIALKHDFNITMKPYVDQLKGSNFNLVWTLAVRVGFKMCMDQTYAPLSLITPFDNLKKKPELSEELADAIENWDQDPIACFFNIKHLYQINPSIYRDKAACFILCCDREISTAVMARSALPRTRLVPMYDDETLEEFCRRLVCLQLSEDIPTEVVEAEDFSHVGVVWV